MRGRNIFSLSLGQRKWLITACRCSAPWHNFFFPLSIFSLYFVENQPHIPKEHYNHSHRLMVTKFLNRDLISFYSFEAECLPTATHRCQHQNGWDPSPRCKLFATGKYPRQQHWGWEMRGENPSFPYHLLLFCGNRSSRDIKCCILARSHHANNCYAECIGMSCTVLVNYNNTVVPRRDEQGIIVLGLHKWASRSSPSTTRYKRSINKIMGWAKIVKLGATACISSLSVVLIAPGGFQPSQ